VKRGSIRGSDRIQIGQYCRSGACRLNDSLAAPHETMPGSPLKTHIADSRIPSQCSAQRAYFENGSIVPKCRKAKETASSGIKDKVVVLHRASSEFGEATAILLAERAAKVRTGKGAWPDRGRIWRPAIAGIGR